eukprot:TCONS_00009839-protein
MTSNFSSFKKLTSRAFSYLLDAQQQHPSIVAYTRYSLPRKYTYARPNFLELDEEATIASSDHEIRPVILPKRPLIMNAGYAEVINAGKTPQTNEDQATFCSFVITVPQNMREEGWTKEQCQLPCVYFAVFDGHAGYDAALFAQNRLHFHVKERLTQIANMLVMPQDEIERKYFTMGLIMDIDADKLIIGALEEAFHTFDDELRQERFDFHVQGGCTVVVCVIIKGKLYVAGAGDSRAVLYRDNNPVAMSRDHTPESERKRIQTVTCYNPDLVRGEYTPLQFQHRCRKKDLGTRQLYRNHLMDGWSFKVVDKNDLKPQVICGEGKRARLLDTIGTTRGFGDHDLEVPYMDGLKIKPFMLSSPEVFVYDLENETFSDEDVLVMATDGLWERLTNENVGELVNTTLKKHSLEENRKYLVAAQALVDESRGVLSERGWRTIDNAPATYDDVSVFVIPLKEWKRTLDLVVRSTRPGSSVILAGEEYCNIPHNPLSVIGDRLTEAELDDVTKGYDDVSKTVEVRGLENQRKRANESLDEGPQEKAMQN